MTVISDYNLLFVYMALRMELITHEEMVTAMEDWVREKQSRIGQLLVRNGVLTEAKLGMLEELVARYIEMHDGTEAECLATLSTTARVHEYLQGLDDADLEASLAKTQAIPSQTTPTSGSPHADPDDAGKAVRYRVLRLHAEGGLGKVYVAHDEELRREVALKEIKHAQADDPEYRRRFTLEAEVTGGLEHPGIVPVYGLGRYRDGRPFYAMRFIRGDSLKLAINRFHEQRSSGALGGDEMLELRKLLGRFIDVCQAIEYAHSRGVLHRDLKPGNIMLGKYGETLVVDWGLAKTIGDDDPEVPRSGDKLTPQSASGSAPTAMGSTIGTPAYMSPEQAAGRLDVIGTSTDVYALGATLYHLLTGQPPVTAENVSEVLQRVQQGRITPIPATGARVPVPLAAVCYKALATNPEDRYASAEALADDVEHWLADEPVAAHKDGWSARLFRWVRRHRAWAVSAAAALMLVTVVSTVAAVIIAGQKQQISEQKNTALALAESNKQLAEREAEANAVAQQQKTEAVVSRDQAEAVVSYLVSTFRSADPAEQGRGVTVAETLDRALATLSADESIQLPSKARIFASLGKTYLGLGLGDKAVDAFSRSREIMIELRGPDHPETLGVLDNLAAALREAGEIQEARKLIEQTLRQRTETLGSTHPGTLQSIDNAANIYLAAGESELATKLLRDALSELRDSRGDDDPLTLITANSLARALREVGQNQQSRQLLEQTTDRMRSVLGEDHPDRLSGMHNLALAYKDAGDFARAAEQYRSVLAMRGEQLGDLHPDTLVTRSNLASVLREAGQAREALPLGEELVQLQTDALGRDHPDTMISLNNLAMTLQRIGELKRAIPLYEESLRLRRKKYGSNQHPAVLRAMHNLALGHLDDGQYDRALPQLEQVRQLTEEKLGHEHVETLNSRNALADAYLRTGKLPEAIELFETTLELRRKTQGPKHFDTLGAMNNLANAYISAGRRRDAIGVLEKVTPLLDEVLGADHPNSVVTLGNLANALLRDGQLEKGIPMAEIVVERQREISGPSHRNTIAAMSVLAGAYGLAKRYDDSLRISEELSRISREELGPDHPWTLAGINGLAVAYRDVGRRDEAIELFAKVLPIMREKLSDSHPITQRTESNYGQTLESSGQLERAVEIFEACLARNESKSGADAPPTVSSRLDVARCRFALKQYKKAESLYRTCLEHYRKTAPEDAKTFAIQGRLGSALVEQQRWEEAEPLLLEAWQGLTDRLDQMPKKQQAILGEVAASLKTLYTKTDRPEKAKQWDEKLRNQQNKES